MDWQKMSRTVDLTSSYEKQVWNIRRWMGGCTPCTQWWLWPAGRRKGRNVTWRLIHTHCPFQMSITIRDIEFLTWTDGDVMSWFTWSVMSTAVIACVYWAQWTARFPQQQAVGLTVDFQINTQQKLSDGMICVCNQTRIDQARKSIHTYCIGFWSFRTVLDHWLALPD